MALWFSTLEKVDNPPRLLIAGGTGFIGHHLIYAAIQRGWQVTSVSLHPPSSIRRIGGTRYLIADLTQLQQLRGVLDDDYDYVVNLGGYINHQLFQAGGRLLIDHHFTAVQNLVEMVASASLKRFIQIGSSDEYGGAPSPQRENLRESPISPYSLAKAASTHFLQMLHRTEAFPAVILRLFLVYGPGQNAQRFLPQIIQGCLLNKTFPTSSGEQIRDFCYVEDVVNAVFKTLTSESNNVDGQILNIASGQPISIREVIETVIDLTARGNADFGAIPYREGENMSLYADISRAGAVLDWCPSVQLEDGLKRTIGWYEKYL